MKKTAILCVTIAFCLISFVTSASAAEGSSGEQVRLRLELIENGDGEYELILYQTSPHGICGMLGELFFNCESLLLLGCGSEHMNVTYEDRGGAVRFLLDKSGNTPLECSMISFYFKRISSIKAEISLELPDKSGCLYVNMYDELRPLAVSLPEPVVIASVQNDRTEPETPQLISASAETEDKDIWLLHFDVSIPAECFSAGIKLFALDLESGESCEYYIFGISDRDGYLSASVSIRLYKKAAVIITAAGYERNGAILGEKEVIFCGLRSP